MWKEYQQDPGVSVLGIYCKYDDPDTQELGNLSGSLARQLISRPSDILDSISSRFAQQKLKTNLTQPSIGELTALSKGRALIFHKVLIILDVLDEYPEKSQGELVSKPLELQPTASLLITSRLTENSPIIFEGEARLQIMASKEDIRAYVTKQINYLGRLPRLVRTKPDLGELIKSKVVLSARDT